MEDSGVLFVDDDRDILKLATTFFESLGMAVHCAASGEEALGKVRERRFCLMVTDLNMPGLDGLQLARRVREIAPDMPVVMGTGDASPEISRLAAEAGISRVLDKPYHIPHVLALIRQEGCAVSPEP